MSTLTDFTAADGWYKAEDKMIVWSILKQDGSVQPIIGLTIKFSVSATRGGADLSGFPITAVITDGPNGICTVTVPSAQTAGLAASPPLYWYTLWVTDSGEKTELAGGSIDLLAPQTVVPS